MGRADRAVEGVGAQGDARRAQPATTSLAKEALSRKAEHDHQQAEFGKQWQLQKDAVDKLKDQLRSLNDKIEEAKRKKNILIARQKRAEAQKAIQDTMRGLSDNSAFDTFERMNQKVEQIEAESEASTELGGELTGDTLQQKFKKLEGSSGSDMALAELKAKMGLGPDARRSRATRGENRRRKAVRAPAGLNTTDGEFPSVSDSRDCRTRGIADIRKRYQLQKELTARWHKHRTTRRRDSTA